MDKLLSSYRPKIQGKKWYFPFLPHFLNICVTNAWNLHRRTVSSPLSHLDFRRQITKELLNTPMAYAPREIPGRQPTVATSRRFSGWNHFPVALEKQLRCANCHQKAKYKCLACGITLHPICFLEYHAHF